MSRSTEEAGAVAYDEGLAERIRGALDGRPRVEERRMFGGLAFMVDGHMTCGIVGDSLMLRAGPEAAESALARPHVRPMDLTGRPMRGMVYVDPPGIEDDEDLRAWIDVGLAFVATLPPRP